MTARLLATFGLVALMTGLASAQDKKAEAQEKPSAKAQVKEALEAANEDLPKAIGMLEKILKTAPEEREALYLLGAMTAVQADKTDDKAERIALFHKSTAAFKKLGEVYKTPTPYEKAFKARSLVGEARALALEGKTKESLAVIQQAMKLGFDDLSSIESEKDLEAVAKLPELKAMIEAANKAQLEEAKKQIAEEMSGFKSFPFDFELKDADDKTVTLDGFKGKVAIVDVWGTWCPPCRDEIPHFVDLYKRYHAKGLEIVGINCNEQGSRDEIKKTIKDFAKKMEIPYPCVLNDDKTEEKVPGFQGYPTTLFLDRAGKVRMMTVGFRPQDKAKLEYIVTTLLAESPTSPEVKAEPKAK